MTLLSFKASLLESDPPEGLSVYLKSLWYDAKGNWHESHDLISDVEDKTAAWIHAYLHRKEGDTGNADYWYRRAGKKRPGVLFEDEWQQIADSLT